jgi:gliding motility-associated-like protein
VLNTDIIPDTTIELGTDLQLYALGGVTYLWTPGDYLSSVTVANPVMTPLVTGVFNYSVLITDLQGCATSRKVNVTVLPSTEVVIPDLYTPNGDGVNDTWEVPFLQPLTDYTVRIFSRGGLEVWNTELYQNDWDGTHYKTGKILPDGTYYYIIRLADGTEFKGPVTIKR